MQGTAFFLDYFVQVLKTFWLGLLPFWFLVSFVEVKLVADLQARVGPNQVGKAGSGQFFYDLLKLLQKRSGHSGTFKEWLGWFAYFFVFFATLAAWPMHSKGILSNSDFALFVPLLSTSILTLISLFLTSQKKTVEKTLASFRSAGFFVAGIFPALIILISVGVEVGGYQWKEIIDQQSFLPGSWILFKSFPFHFVGFFILLIAGVFIFNVQPVDAATHSLDLSSEQFPSLSGVFLLLLRMIRFFMRFSWCIALVALYLGGWNLPHQLQIALQQAADPGWLIFLETLWTFVKAGLLSVGIALCSHIIPRIRIDQASDIACRILSPLAVLVLLGVTLYRLF